MPTGYLLSKTQLYELDSSKNFQNSAFKARRDSLRIDHIEHFKEVFFSYKTKSVREIKTTHSHPTPFLLKTKTKILNLQTIKRKQGAHLISAMKTLVEKNKLFQLSTSRSYSSAPSRITEKG